MEAAEAVAPCPFCGAAPEDCPQNSERPHPKRKGDWCTYIWCDNCNARGPEKREPAEAAAAWNTRAYEANPTEIEELREELQTPKMQAKVAVAIAEAVAGQDFELSPPQSLYASMKALDAIQAALLTRIAQPENRGGGE